MLVSQLQNQVSIVLRDVWGREIFVCERFQNHHPSEGGSGVTYRECKFRLEDQFFQPGTEWDSHRSCYYGHTCMLTREELLLFEHQCKKWVQGYSPVSKRPHLNHENWYLAVTSVSSQEDGYVEIVVQYKPRWWSRTKETRYTVELSVFSEFITEIAAEALL